MKTAEQILIEQGYCQCPDVYKERGLIAPDCQIHNMQTAFDAYAEQFKQKWISVEEYLPEYGQSVYTYSPAQEDTNECQRIITCGTLKAGFPCGVTHWMPMPEPPNT